MASVRGAWRRCWPVLVVAGLALPLGCRRPVAPAITNDPVYQNDREGFRFLAPDGWTQSARSDVPPGKVTKERQLVEYRRYSGGKAATLEVSLADLPPTEDLAKYLAGPASGVSEWRLKAGPEKVEVKGVPGLRFDYTGSAGKEPMAREVVAFRRGERVYFFSAVYSARDTTAQEQVRRSVQSLLWKG